MSMELPFHLKTLEPLPGALDIIRYLGGAEDQIADADEICDALELSERGFSKAIRRLVTKGYVAMDGDQVYRLTEQGAQAAQELGTFYAATGGPKPASSGPRRVIRRLVVALPRAVVAHVPNEILVGFHEADLGHLLTTPAEVVLRLSVVNGKPEKPEDAVMNVSNMPVHQSFEVVPGAFTQMRVKVQVFQLNPDSDDVEKSGGMYVDVDVAASDGGERDLVAYGIDLYLMQ